MTRFLEHGSAARADRQSSSQEALCLHLGRATCARPQSCRATVSAAAWRPGTLGAHFIYLYSIRLLFADLHGPRFPGLFGPPHSRLARKYPVGPARSVNDTPNSCAARNPGRDDVVQRHRCIYSGMSRHDELLSCSVARVNIKYKERPQSLATITREA